MKPVYKLVLIMFVAFMCSLCAAVELTQADIDAQFKKANDLFRQANEAKGEEAVKLYGEAILHFERIVKEGGIKNAGLYYNIGNAYLLKGDIGRAILNYRRSQLLDPANPDLQKNLAFARSSRVDQVDVAAEKKVLHTLFFWHYDFSVKVRFFMACLFFGILCLVLAAMIWFGRKGPMLAVCVICGLLAGCFALSVIVETASGAGRNAGVIVSESVVGRTGDGHNYPKSFKEPLHGGTEFELVKSQSGWFNIRLSDGSEGWVPVSSAELISNF